MQTSGAMRRENAKSFPQDGGAESDTHCHTPRRH